MAAITIQTIKAPFAAITAGSADVTWTAGSTDGDTIACNGRDILLVYNSSADTVYTCTVTSVANAKGRTGDIASYSLAAGDFAAFGVGLTLSPGWRNSSTGLIALDVENAAVKWMVLRLPTGYPG
jgi:hypothetical protein